MKIIVFLPTKNSFPKHIWVATHIIRNAEQEQAKWYIHVCISSQTQLRGLEL